jgi:hypothetical protein
MKIIFISFVIGSIFFVNALGAERSQLCIEKLLVKDNMVNKDFFNCFPATGFDFLRTYGFSEKAGPAPFYDQAELHILEYLVKAKSHVRAFDYYRKISNLAADLKYDADAQFYFREFLLVQLSTDLAFDLYLSNLTAKKIDLISSFITSSILGDYRIRPKCLPKSKFCSALLEKQFRVGAQDWTIKPQ